MTKKLNENKHQRHRDTCGRVDPAGAISILPEQLLDLLNNSYKAVYSRNLSAEDRISWLRYLTKLLTSTKICSITCTQTGPE